MVYAPVIPDVLLEGEWTNILNAGVLACHRGPAGPASTRCLSASPKPRMLIAVRSSSTASAIDAEVSSLECPDVVPKFIALGGGGAAVPLSTNASAPLVTKLENRFRDFPPRRLWRKLGKAGSHSPVFCGMRAGSDDWDCEERGEPRGVIDELDVSRFLC